MTSTPSEVKLQIGQVHAEQVWQTLILRPWKLSAKFIACQQQWQCLIAGLHACILC